MAMEYSEKVMEHFAHPHNVGVIEDANGVGEVGNAKCGDIMRMYLKINDDGIIEDVKFQTFGCASAIATSSIATDMIKGKPVEEALTLTNKAVVEALDGLPAVKIHCSVLAEQAVKAAVADYYKRKGIPYAGPCATVTAAAASMTTTTATRRNNSPSSQPAGICKLIMRRRPAAIPATAHTFCAGRGFSMDFLAEI